MTNRKTTKRALLSSVLALILCFAMLLGSTWAWFTDTATTNVNTIQAGTLDIQLLGGTNFDTDLENGTIAFVNKNGSTDILWEPGVTFYTEAFKVNNAGNLALKYEIVVSGANATNVGNANLLDVIKFTIVDANDAAVAGGNLDAGVPSGAFRVKAHMAETAGNEYQGCTLSGVVITVYATQDTVEEDANNNRYDANATFPVLDTDVNEINDALANANVSTVTLPSNVTTDASLNLNGKTLDGNGNTITATGNMMSNGQNTDPVVYATAGTIQNLTVMGAGRGVGTRGALEGDLTVNNYTANGGSYALHVGSGNNHALTVKNSNLNGWTSFGTGFSSVTFENTKFAQGTTGYNNIRAYSNVTFTNCDFTNTILAVGDSTPGVVLTFVNCTYNGKLITADMFEMFVVDATNCGHSATVANYAIGTANP